jgi:hypothetical protein
MADKSAVGAINRPLLVRQSSFGAGEIASQPLWMDTKYSNEVWRTTTGGRIYLLMSIVGPDRCFHREVFRAESEIWRGEDQRENGAAGGRGRRCLDHPPDAAGVSQARWPQRETRGRIGERDEGDPRVPTLPLIHPRPYGNWLR